MDPFAEVEDVEARWRTLTAAEKIVASTLLEDASDMIRVRWPDIDGRLASGGIADITLIRVVSNMVRRAMLNRDTEGVTQIQQTAGPYQAGATFSNPNNNLYLSADDVATIDSYGVRGRGRMGWLA